MFGLPKSGEGIGFRRLLEFCDRQQIDLEALGRTSIVITGSNGKGSTARFLYECLRGSVERIGLFTSPHLWDVRERFEVSGTRIDDATLDGYVRRIRSCIDGLGAFELLFLVAVSWFHDRGVTCAVWEAGIGGRYDPVRVLRSPLSALTSVDLEHTELLGATKQLIAFDKLDVTRPFGRTFVSPAVDSALEPELEAFARVTDRSLTFVSREAAIADVRNDRESMRYTMAVPGRRERLEVTIPLLGMHQVHNSATAIHLASAHHPGWNPEAGLEAWRRMEWHGRLEKIAENPETWIDVGHTPEAVERACETLESLFDPAELLVVFGVSANKSVAGIASIINRRFRRVILTRAYKGGFDARRLAAEHFDPSRIAGVTGTVEDAVELSRSLAGRHGLPIAVLGGLFLAIEFAHAWRGEDPRTLDFF